MRIWNNGEILVGLITPRGRRIIPSIYEQAFIKKQILNK